MGALMSMFGGGGGGGFSGSSSSTSTASQQGSTLGGGGGEGSILFGNSGTTGISPAWIIGGAIVLALVLRR